jgi:hypothetical protein
MGLLEKLNLTLPRAALLATAGGPDDDGQARDAADTKEAAPPAGPSERELNVSRRLIEALGKKYDEGMAAAQGHIAAQPVPALKARLEKEVEPLERARAEIDALDPVAGAKRISLVSSQAGTFALRCEGMLSDAKNALRDIDLLADRPLAALKKRVAGLAADPKARFEPYVKMLDPLLAEARERLDKGDFDGLIKPMMRVKTACDTITYAVENDARHYPDYAAYRWRVQDMLDRMQARGMFDGDGAKGLAELRAALTRSDALGPLRGYDTALDQLKLVAGKAKALRENNEAYVTYQGARDATANAIAALRAHRAGPRLDSEIDELDAQLKQADKLAKAREAGSLKALTALRAIDPQAAALKTLAGEIVAAEARLPELKKKLEAGGVDKKKMERTANVALKLLVEEKCSDDEAVKMARDASGYADEGLPERDAVMSSRVKHSLEKQGIAPAHAKAVGRNLRAGGSSSAVDAKEVAAQLAKLPPKVIDKLNAAKIQTECCRGAITEAMPELAGVLPRGWHETTTWDQVDGVYSPDNKKLVVGTKPAGGDSRKVDLGLVGHEAGHAFDDADDTPKRGHKDFLAARQADIDAAVAARKAKAATVPGMYGPRDNYFLTKKEGGDNDKGATSETFAESFAHNATGDTRWPNLKKFWAKNPWGV